MGICALLLKRCCTSSRFKGFCSQTHPLSSSLREPLSHPLSLLLFPFIPPSLSYLSTPSLSPFPFLLFPLTRRSTLIPFCLALCTADYLALIQNVIKENDQLPQLPPSFLLSAPLSSVFCFFFMPLCVTPDPALRRSREANTRKKDAGRRWSQLHFQERWSFKPPHLHHRTIRTGAQAFSSQRLLPSRSLPSLGSGSPPPPVPVVRNHQQPPGFWVSGSYAAEKGAKTGPA